MRAPEDIPDLERLQRLQVMLSAVSECFKIVDSDLLLCDMNPAGLELIEADRLEDVEGVCVLELLLPEYHAAFRAGIEAALAGERVTSEFEIRGLRGTRRWMQQVAVAMPPAPGEDRPTEVAAFTRDITALRETMRSLDDARREAQAANEAKTRFLANMSHEIRTPMTAILGYADLLTSDDTFVGDPDRVREALLSVRANADHLLGVLNDILDISKIEAGQIQIEKVEVDAEELILDIAEVARRIAAEKNLAFSIDWETDLPRRITTDPLRLRQVLLNLVSNAFKFTTEGRVSIGVSLDETAEELRIRVHDTGIGMTAEQKSRVGRFEAFVQADAGTTRRFGGSGLGLTISHALARLLGGSLSFDSIAGVGSRFEVRIATGSIAATPRVRPGMGSGESVFRRRASARPVTPSPEGALGGLRILLVEDGEDNRTLIRFMLSRAGAEVETCEDGRQAVDLVSSRGGDSLPDLILMDMQMPVLDGYEATRILRDRGIRVPIIALTAHAMSGDRERCLENGCDDYATKPIRKADLVELVHRWTKERTAHPDTDLAR